MKQDKYTKNVLNLPSRLDCVKRTGRTDVFYMPRAQNLKRCILHCGANSIISHQEAHRLILALGLRGA